MAEVTVARYLFERIQQLGVKSVFGVPGDYELALLDYIPEAGLKWRGNPNELNAGYAADGYARVNGVGAVVTTFGPGELSNLCGIAGAYTEFVPIVHIVGYPTEAAQNGNNIMHHSLGEVGDGKFDVYHKMSEHITCATTVLHNSQTAAAEIDRVLNAMMHFSQPCYIGVPVDITPKKISSASLSTPLTTTLPPNPADLQAQVINEIYQKLRTASSPTIIVDGGATRNKFLVESENLVKATGIPYFMTAMGKGAITESLPSFGGIYEGAGSVDGARIAVEASDCILWLGNYPSDFNTGEFTEKFNKSAVIDFQRFYIKIGQYTRYQLSSKYVLSALTTHIEANPLTHTSTISWDPYPAPPAPLSLSEPLSQDFLWATLGPYFKANDVIISETGTSAYGIPASSLQHLPNVTMFNQTVFGSIGYAAGASVGAFVASLENPLSPKPRRHILVTGEGSLQLTIQAFSDLLRHNTNPQIFLLNNGGYTIERLIHGREAEYNTVPVWDYEGLFRAFGGGKGERVEYYRVGTKGELIELLGRVGEGIEGSEKPRLVELMLGVLDAPASVVRASKAVEEFNTRGEK
ncbi:hypothetical protein G7Y89_g8550 [Cudoniella acicularis]|uniref:Pyruvate decarboxylase n=1 Tax=Cudoniella acicularis TaxID=354080 RepID=A0A8H4W3G2_9HELO|nr:hypothetical protein G7Y89_g8550 [Cudoniella acicularis]